tara:strand:+ start:699 stop:1040 length:342 start_codon:yes stop_codon:yes gene_type:complete
MYKQILSFLALIALSAAIVLSLPQAKQAIDFLITAHHQISILLTEVFSAGHAGNIARGLVALMAIPFIVGFVPSLIYFLIRKHWMPCFMDIVWVVWLVQAGALIAGSALPVTV